MKVLYITYDGLTDFIGQSQVLPYLIGCARAGHQLTVVSFEKSDRLARLGEVTQRACRDAGLAWLPNRFRSFPPHLAKLFDQQVMRRVAVATQKRNNFDLIHCRSYPAAFTGLELKKRYGAILLFDMRGFWPDQRREGGRWTDETIVGRTLYKRWKANEAALVRDADHIIVLANSAKVEVKRWTSYNGTPVSVIPCCADFDLFRVAAHSARVSARRRLNLQEEAPVLAYLGSTGTVYLIEQHLRLFEAIRTHDPSARLLFIGRDEVSFVMAEARRINVALEEEEIRVVSAERSEVPFWLGAACAGTCFIVPTFSSKGVSPTKLAEYLACGIPVIGNRGVGDVGTIIQAIGGGHVMDDFRPDSIDAAARAFFALRSIDREALRHRARASLDLPQAIAAYARIYNNVQTPVSMAAWTAQ